MIPGDTVRWRSKISSDRTRMTVFSVHGNAVKVDHAGGSIISKALLEIVGGRGEPNTPMPAEANGWTGRKCPDCEGSGRGGDYDTPCGSCGGTGDEWGPPAAEDDGLMAVIETQMAALDDAQETIRTLEAYNAGADEGFREEVKRMVEGVCAALGFERAEPWNKTGIPELDALVRYVGDQ